ncbi:hypothetical protein HBI42_164510 [Parastagonospora nodorum]|nr:hypothetical protein HBI71_215760 [Parastagonospora nodorum]KAH5396518.1 hypothetical protein HBI47_223660 [Parastagonospora nodorum]KAH6205267.1 hypothetical protein HBI43_195890 [Parastagonospora nodorum]KAH6249973.1 hypothetical protein HBI42_164510 [Parastagonospora nodorum]
MARSKTSSLSSSKLKDILNVYRICFEAAVKAERKPSVTGLSQHPSNERVWRIYQDCTTSWDVPDGASKAFVEAYKKWSLCDNFCVMVYDALKEHLKKYNADVSWRIISPNPVFSFLSGDDELRQYSHSVVVVETKEGKTFIFDCTGEQFGWNGSEWLMELEEFSERMDEDELPDRQGSLGFTRRVISKQPDGYWPRIFTTFSQMFKAFNWEGLPLEDPALALRAISSTAAERAEAAALESWGPSPQK